MYDLNPCPFCGSGVELGTTGNEEWIACTLCPASMSHNGSVAALIEMWNYRQII